MLLTRGQVEQDALTHLAKHFTDTLFWVREFAAFRNVVLTLYDPEFIN